MFWSSSPTANRLSLALSSSRVRPAGGRGGDEGVLLRSDVLVLVDQDPAEAVVKMVDFSHTPSRQPFLNAQSWPRRRPNLRQAQVYKAAPSGNRTRNHRTDPHPGYPRELMPARTPESDWGGLSISPAYEPLGSITTAAASRTRRWTASRASAASARSACRY